MLHALWRLSGSLHRLRFSDRTPWAFSYSRDAYAKNGGNETLLKCKIRNWNLSTISKPTFEPSVSGLVEGTLYRIRSISRILANMSLLEYEVRQILSKLNSGIYSPSLCRRHITTRIRAHLKQSPRIQTLWAPFQKNIQFYKISYPVSTHQEWGRKKLGN